MSNAELIAEYDAKAVHAHYWGLSPFTDKLRNALEATDKNLRDALDDRAGWKHSGGELIRQKTELLAENQRLRAVIEQARAALNGIPDISADAMRMIRILASADTEVIR